MYNALRRLTVLIPLIGLLSFAAGCSQQQNTVASSDQDLSWASQGQAEDQFLAAVEKLPPDQRKDYVASHRDQLNQVQTDPDKSKLDKLDSLLPPEIP